MVRYSEETKELAIKAYKASGSNEEVAKIVGVAESTIRRWKKKYPDFAKAVEAAMRPDDSDKAVARLARRKESIEKRIDEYLETGLAKRIVCDGDGLGSYTKDEFHMLPDKWVMERILGPAEQRQEEDFKVTISVAMPEPDDDGEFFEDEDE